MKNLMLVLRAAVLLGVAALTGGGHNLLRWKRLQSQ
jgi:hypothetical protein